MGPVSGNSQSPRPLPPRHVQSPDLPEGGSVKDKIGKFSAYSQPYAGRDASRIAPPESVGVIRSRTPQQIAAQLAAGRSTPGERIAPNTGISRVQGSQRVPSKRSDDNDRPQLLAPTPVWATAANTASFDKILQREPELPLRAKSTQRKPVPQVSPVDAAQLAAAKPRPPPVPRKSPVLSSGPISVPSHVRSEGIENHEHIPRPHPSLRSNEAVLSETPPILPPRPGSSFVPLKDSANHRLLLEATGSRMRSSTPGTASLYTPSLSNSTVSLLDSASGLEEGASSDAIAASSLASVRASQEQKVAPPPPPRRRARSHSIKRFSHAAKQEHSSSPSPSTHLRQTLRDPTKTDDEEGYHRHKNLLRKHPHKHHEGDRRRWRSEITEKERKRYEGVWAANKGLLLPPEDLRPPEWYPPDASDMVVNLVVQDIWSRSRLPRHALAQVWDLVDGQDIGLLTREEFVVGMWLIDQQLKGHKLPPRIPNTVWGSVKRVPGVHIHGLPPA
ncbi:increased rDNA silencing protein 4 [Aspergillus ellipticus CBS 707.79]|uniref:Increased rDNA silencing protein 4 n=1 Tax=Aspergillus ellipticus CBS 707.79 TaxID=1448320 RepID=A0A319EX99_9EURO|nr:increased rDNA silencing protein 4 [Aspergillus ellipticus CBS 707.79]